MADTLPGVDPATHTAPYPFFDHAGVLAFAHRGGATYAPNLGIENSMRAFENAIALGYRYLETDVHATADGVLLAFHDAELDRATDRAGSIANLPYDEVAKARIGGREPIPQLVEILDAWPEARVNIDVKAEGAIAPLTELIRATRSQDRVCLASFSTHRLRATRRGLGPRVASSLAPLEAAVARHTPRWLARLVLPDAQCVQLPPSWWKIPILTRHFIETLHNLGLQVHAWTIDERAQIEELLDLGVNGIITDRIDTLKKVLIDRSLW